MAWLLLISEPMNADEKAIIEYLKGMALSLLFQARKSPGSQAKPDTKKTAVVFPILAQMVRTGLVEKDELGYFRFAMGHAEEKAQEQARVTPNPDRKCLRETAGKFFDGIVIDEDLDESLAYLKPSAPATGEGQKNG